MKQFTIACFLLTSLFSTLNAQLSPKSITGGISILQNGGSGVNISYSTGYISEKTPSFLKFNILYGKFYEEINSEDYRINVGSIGVSYYRELPEILKSKDLLVAIGVGANLIMENSADNPYYDGNISEFDLSYTDPNLTFGPNLAVELSYNVSEKIALSAEFNNYYFLYSNFKNYRNSINLGLRYRFRSKKTRDFQKKELTKTQIENTSKEIDRLLQEVEQSTLEIEKEYLKQLEELKKELDKNHSSTKTTQNISI